MDVCGAGSAVDGYDYNNGADVSFSERCRLADGVKTKMDYRRNVCPLKA